MQIEVVRERIEELYPNLAAHAQFVLESRANKSGKPIEPVTFEFNYSSSITGNRPRVDSTLQEQTLWVEQTTGWIVTARMGRRQISFVKHKGLPEDSPIPDEIIQHKLAGLARDHTRQREINALTPEEREHMGRKALSGLKGKPGFVEIIVNPEEPTSFKP